MYLRVVILPELVLLCLFQVIQLILISEKSTVICHYFDWRFGALMVLVCSFSAGVQCMRERIVYILLQAFSEIIFSYKEIALFL